MSSWRVRTIGPKSGLAKLVGPCRVMSKHKKRLVIMDLCVAIGPVPRIRAMARLLGNKVLDKE